jgi:ParB/RepB/Spo0J family partition protein
MHQKDNQIRITMLSIQLKGRIMDQFTEIPLDQIEVSMQNTRKDLKQGNEDASLEDLAKSIQEHGLLNPITVRSRTEGGYEVIAGQRRLLAFRFLGRTLIPAVIRADVVDEQAMAISLIENMQRADMAPLDKARSLSILSERYGSVAEVSKQTGVSTTTIRKYLTLMRLPESVAGEFKVADGSASISVAAAIATTFTDQEEMKKAWEQVKGFKAGIAERVIKSSNGNLQRVEENKILAAEGAFDLERCGTSLATCPYVPKSARAEILRIAKEAS